MVISEKALLREIKEEYRGQGYTVAARENEAGELVMVIEAADWLAEIEWKNLPAKLLGLVAEHLKVLPTLGQAFKVQKKETQTTIFNLVDRMPEVEPDAPVIVAHRTRLMYENMEVWQKDGNNGCMFIPAETAALMLDYGRLVQWVSGGVYIQGKASRIFVRHSSYKTTDHQQDAINFLNGKRWW